MAGDFFFPIFRTIISFCLLVFVGRETLQIVAWWGIYYAVSAAASSLVWLLKVQEWFENESGSRQTGMIGPI